MRLEVKRVCGQGLVTALAGISRTDTLIAAVCASLKSLTAKDMVVRAEVPDAHSDLITGLCARQGPSASSKFERLFASCSRVGEVRTWSVTDAKMLPQKSLDLGAVAHDVSWCGPEGEAFGNVAVAQATGKIVIWNLDTDARHALDSSPEPVLSVDWFPDGVHLASGGQDGILRIWELPSGAQAEGGLLTHYNPIKVVRVSRCGRYVAFLSDDEKGAVFDLSHKRVSKFGEPGDAVTAMAWHPTKPLLLFGTERGSSRMYDAAAESLVPTESPDHLHSVSAAAFAGAKVARPCTAGRDGSIFAHEPKGEAWHCAHQHAPHPSGYALAVRWAGDDTLVSSYSDGNVVIWKDGRATVLPSPHTKPVYGLAVSPDRKTVASASVDKTVKVWDLAERMQVHNLDELHKKPVYDVAFSPDGRHVATGSGDTYLVVYDIQKLKAKSQESFGQDEYWHFTIKNRVLNAVAWAPSERRIAVGLANHSIVILDVDKDGNVQKGPTLKAHEDAVSAVVWGAKASVLVSVGYDRRIVIWDAKTLRPLCERVVEHEEPIQAVAVHPRGDIIATGSWDGTIRLWNEELEQQGLATQPHFSAVEGLDFDESGDRLASASSDGTVIIWTVHRD